MRDGVNEITGNIRLRRLQAETWINDFDKRHF